MDNEVMSIDANEVDLDPQEEADSEAVFRHAFEELPLDPEVARRVEERADRIIEQNFRARGCIDDETFQKLLDDDDEP
jgi:hypothetical protein